MNSRPDVSLILLHDQMLDKHSKIVTTSITLIDIHDMARTSHTYGLTNVFVAHPSKTLQDLAKTLKSHWKEGFGATYNPNRKEALEIVQVVNNLDDAVQQIEARTGKPPKLIATSARDGEDRVPFAILRQEISDSTGPYLVMLGTGWGMSESLLSRAHSVLEPIKGRGEYNHLPVRAACAIILDRLFG